MSTINDTSTTSTSNVNTNTVSVRNWWMVCLTRSSYNTGKSTKWPVSPNNIVDKIDFYQQYLNACVGTPVTQARFWHEMNKWVPWEESEFPMGPRFTIRSLTNCRNQFNSTRDWTTNNVFTPVFDLNMIPSSLTNWWGKTLVTGRWSNQTINKTTLYNDYVRFATSEGLAVARQPRFWRFLHHTHSKTGETWNTVTFGSREDLQKASPKAYSIMLNEHDTAFGIKQSHNIRSNV